MLSPDQIVFPNMPIGVFLQESFNIYNFIQDDKELFIKKGFNWGIMEEFPERMNYLRQKEAELWKEKYGENVIIKGCSLKLRQPICKDYATFFSSL